MERARLSLGEGKARPALTAARERLHYTLEEVGTRLGVSKSTVYRWEKKGDFPQPYHLRELCELYSLSAQELGFEESSAFEGLPGNETTREGEEEARILNAFRQHNSVSRLMRIVWNWPSGDARYQKLQAQIRLELEDNAMNDDLSRREALRFLALVPVDMLGLSSFGAVLKRGVSPDDILKHCAAAIAACWQLRKSKELPFADVVVSHYIPTLKVLAQTAPLTQRKVAADLLAQCLLLKATLSRHVEASNKAVSYAEQAELYGEQAGSLLLRILALRTQAASYYYANLWTPALHAAEKARYLLEERDRQDQRKQPSVCSQPAEEPLPQLVSSYVYAGLATYQACNGEKEAALLSLKKAHKTFSYEPAPIWIDHNQANLILNDGMAHYHLGQYKEALDSFAQIKCISQDEIGRVETLIDEVMTEVSRDDRPRDMQWCIAHWVPGIQGARALQCQQRINEAIQAYTAMCAAWPGEKQVKDLRDYLVRS